MSDGRLHLDPVRTMDGARNLAAAGADLAALRVGSGARVEAAGAARPWGTDDIGKAFDGRYAPVAGQMFEAWTMLAAHLEGLGAAAARSVRENQQADDEAGARITHSYGNR